MKQVTRSLLFVIVASATLVSASQHKPIREPAALHIRAGVVPLLDSSTGNSPQSSSSAAPATSTQPAATTETPTSAVSTPTTSTTAAQTQATSASPSKAATSNASSAPPSTAQAPTTSAVATTNAAGEIFTSVVTITPGNTPSTSTSPTASHTSSSNSSNSGDNGLSTGSIVGLSVSGGIAALAIILFFVWKFTRKRFSDFDDNEAIKWPELNAHNNDVHALPTNSTGRAGFGPENDSDLNLARAPSPGGAYAGSIAASSVPEAYGAGDPYAVPPLPHLNPNQPYHDEPGAYGQPAGYYDPYRGPVPNTFTDPVSDGHGAESIPMTRMRSPGPQAAYDMQGRSSPAPQAAMGYAGMDERSRTPVPAALGTGRASPSPYGYGPQ